MAEEICASLGPVWLRVRSGWLCEGARLEISSLSVSYGEDADALRGLGFLVEPRQKVGIAGAPGSGKSTLLQALGRLVEPRQGQVMLDGLDVSGVGLRSLRSAMGYVPSEPVLVQGSLRYNLDPVGEFSEAEVLEALRCVRLERLIEDEKGLEREITSDGQNLSAGERQLVSVARMVLRQPPLLLVDCPSPAPDAHTRDAMQSAIQNAFARSTVLAVVSRPEALLKFDRVLVLDHNGCQAEYGPPSSLASKPGGALAGLLASSPSRKASSKSTM